MNMLGDDAAFAARRRLAAQLIPTRTSTTSCSEIRVKSTWTMCVPQVSLCKSRMNAESAHRAVK